MSARQILDIRSKYRAVAFRAIESILREDPVLSGVVKSWRSRDGSQDEMMPPTPNQMPLIGLSPIPLPSEVEAVDSLKVNFAISVQLFVRGTCVDDILALWEAVEDAVMDDKPFRDTTVMGFLCQCIAPEPNASGVIRLRSSAPAFSPVEYHKPGNQALSQRGVGTLTCFLRRPTRTLP